jgi:activator of HSP90 ATPase
MRECKDRQVPMNRPTRRQIITGAALAVAGVANVPTVWAQEQMAEEQSKGAEGLLTYLHQEVEFKATRQRIYEALLDSKQFAAFTGMPAEVSREIGGAFTAFGGLIGGRNVELVPNQRIVQAWRPASWGPGVYSMVKFEITEAGSALTRIILDHTGFLEGDFRHLNLGWPLRYWEPLRKFLG